MNKRDVQAVAAAQTAAHLDGLRHEGDDQVGITLRRRAPKERTLIREVGTCGTCQQPLVLDAEVMHATCPCGLTCIPRKFFLAAVRR